MTKYIKPYIKNSIKEVGAEELFSIKIPNNPVIKTINRMINNVPSGEK